MKFPIANGSLIWEHENVTVYGKRLVAKFTQKHAAARKSFARFIHIAEQSTWKHFLEVKEAFPATDFVPKTGTLIFDIGGNKYRLVALVNFREQVLDIVEVLTHEEYSRKDL